MHRPSYRIVSCSKKSSVCVNLVLEACTRQHKRQQPYLSRICSIGSYPAPKNHLFDSSQFTQFYNVTLNIGQPSKPYFLDPDTGSDLTWLQCDAPCVQCTKTPHPLYMPNKNLVPCKDPLCKSLHLHGCKCETPEQCEYEVQYADGGSSFGVLVKGAFSFNFANGEQLKPRLALGLVTLLISITFTNSQFLEIVFKPI